MIAAHDVVPTRPGSRPVSTCSPRRRSSRACATSWPSSAGRCHGRRSRRQYTFDGRDGQATLGDLFDGRSQLIVYHFMFAPGLGRGLPGLLVLGGQLRPIIVHLNARDVTMVAVSRAPLARAARVPAADGVELRLGLLGGQRLQRRLRRLVHAR